MTQLIEVPGIGQVEFPDGMSDADIASAIKKNMPQQSQAPATKKPFQFGGDAGAMLDAADAYGALNSILERLGYKGGGAVTDLASKALPPEQAAGLGYATNVGIQALPTLMGGRAAQAVAEPLMKAASRRMMQAALKPPLKERMNGDAAKAISTLLDEGASVTEGGVLKLRQKIDELGGEIKDALANSTATINKGNVGNRLLDTLELFKNQVNPQADIDALKRAWMGFRNHPDLIGKQEIPVQTAQALKQGTYRMLGDKPYGELQGASVEAQKQLARALRDEVSQAVPEVAAPLSRQSDLINAAKLAERRVAAANNNNLLGLAPLGVTPLSWLMFLADRNPATVSALARATNANASALPALLGQSAGALYGNRVLGKPD